MRLFDTDQAMVQAAVEESKGVRIKSEQMQDGGMEPPDMNWLAGRLGTEFVTFSVGPPLRDAPPGHPHRDPYANYRADVRQIRTGEASSIYRSAGKKEG